MVSRLHFTMLSFGKRSFCSLSIVSTFWYFFPLILIVVFSLLLKTAQSLWPYFRTQALNLCRVDAITSTCSIILSPHRLFISKHFQKPPPKHISLPSLPDNSRPAHYQKRHTQKQLYTDKVIITVITVISLFFVNREELVPPPPPPPPPLTTHHLIFKIPHVL